MALTHQCVFCDRVIVCDSFSTEQLRLYKTVVLSLLTDTYASAKVHPSNLHISKKKSNTPSVRPLLIEL